MLLALWSVLLPACGWGASSPGTATDRISLEDKHRLYSAALAASDSPLDNELFKRVCEEIGIFDTGGKPNDNYAAFVSEHVKWGTRAETEQFRQEISSKDKARDYIAAHLP